MIYTYSGELTEDKLDAIRNTILADTGILVGVEYIN